MDTSNTNFIEIVKELKINNKEIDIPDKDKYSILEIEKHCNYLENTYVKSLKHKYISELVKTYSSGKRDNLISNICFINSIVKKHNKKQYKILHSGKKINYMKNHIKKTIENIIENEEKDILSELIAKTNLKNQKEGHCKLVKSIQNIKRNGLLLMKI